MPERDSYSVSEIFEVEIIDICETAVYSFAGAETLQYFISGGQIDETFTLSSTLPTG